MNKRILLYLAITTLLLTFLLFAVTLSVPAQQDSTKMRLDYNHVRGSAVEYGGLLYTLNFEQQNALISYINEAKEIKVQDFTKSPSSISKIVIYPFNGPEILITPLGYLDDNLYFKSPAWNGGNPLLDQSKGKLKVLLIL